MASIKKFSAKNLKFNMNFRGSTETVKLVANIFGKRSYKANDGSNEEITYYRGITQLHDGELMYISFRCDTTLELRRDYELEGSLKRKLAKKTDMNGNKYENYQMYINTHKMLPKTKEKK